MQTYKAVSGQSIYDVCLQTYGSLDYLYKLMQDNGVQGLDDEIKSRQQFVWDDNLVLDQQQNVAFLDSGVLFATGVSSLGSVYYVLNGNPSQPVQPTPEPYNPQPPASTYQITVQASYTSGTDGTVSAIITDANGNLYTGWDILQIEKEIKPLKPDQYVWNKTTSTLTLIGTTVDAGETLFILLTKIVTE